MPELRFARSTLRIGCSIYFSARPARSGVIGQAPQVVPQVENVVGKPVSKATLVGQISEYVRRGQLFTRPEPSTFALKAWANGVSDKKEPVKIGREAVKGWSV